MKTNSDILNERMGRGVWRGCNIIALFRPPASNLGNNDSQTKKSLCKTKAFSNSAFDMKQRNEKMDTQVARRLKVVRKANGLSQRQLAKQSGVGSGTISLIESMSTQPSVAVLKKILDGIPMDLGYFFSFELKDEKAFHFSKETLVDIGTHGLEYKLVAAGRPNRKIQMLHEFYAPGKDSGRGALSHDGEECAVVIRGRLEVTVGDQSQILEAGDAYYFNSSIPHRFKNVGDDVCEVVSACTPPTF